VILVTQNQAFAGTATYVGGTRSTYVSGFSPLGYKLSAFPHRHIQPFVTGLSGFAVSPRDIPVFNSSSFNYTFEFGAGVEIYQSHTRSIQMEYRYHHLANISSGSVATWYRFGSLKVSLFLRTVNAQPKGPFSRASYLVSDIQTEFGGGVVPVTFTGISAPAPCCERTDRLSLMPSSSIARLPSARAFACVLTLPVKSNFFPSRV